jgi:hypothetical protein
MSKPKKKPEEATPGQGAVQDLTKKAEGRAENLEGITDVIPPEGIVDDEEGVFALPEKVQGWKPGARSREVNPTMEHVTRSNVLSPITKLVCILVDASNTGELFDLLNQPSITPGLIPNMTHLPDIDNMLRKILSRNESLEKLYTVTSGQCSNVEDLKRAIRYLGPVMVETDYNDGRSGEMVICGYSARKDQEPTFKAYIVDSTNQVCRVSIPEKNFKGAYLTVLHYTNPNVRD